MSDVEVKTGRRRRRRKGIRKRIVGGPGQPRLSVFRSNRHTYAQLIDDLTGRTVAASSTNEKAVEKAPGGKRTAAASVGTRLAQRAVEAGVKRVVFDRGGYRYHGRVRALADAAREGGLKF